MLGWLFKRQQLCLGLSLRRWMSQGTPIQTTQQPKNSIDPALLHVACAHYLPKEWSEEEIKKRMDPTGKHLQRVQILYNRLGTHSGKVIFYFPEQQTMANFIRQYNEQYLKTGDGEGVQKVVVSPFRLNKNADAVDEGGCILKLSNLHFDMTLVEVNKIVQDYGQVIDIRLPLRSDGRNLGTAYIQFKTNESKKKFLSFIDGRILLGRKLSAVSVKSLDEMTKAKNEQAASQKKVRPPRDFSRQNSKLAREEVRRKSTPRS